MSGRRPKNSSSSCGCRTASRRTNPELRFGLAMAACRPASAALASRAGARARVKPSSAMASSEAIFMEAPTGALQTPSTGFLHEVHTAADLPLRQNAGSMSWEENMGIRIVRLGSQRHPNEGVRIGTVRRPPRGIPKASFSSGNWYDVWLPNLAPSPETVKLGLAAESEI